MIDTHAADYCPTCGQPRESETPSERFGLSIDCNFLIYGQKRLRLAPAMARFARTLLERGRASHEMILLRVSPETSANLMRVYARHFRKALEQVVGGAIELRTIHSWGYELALAEQRQAA